MGQFKGRIVNGRPLRIQAVEVGGFVKIGLVPLSFLWMILISPETNMSTQTKNIISPFFVNPTFSLASHDDFAALHSSPFL